MSVIFLSGPIGAGKTAVAQELLQLLPAPLSYIEGDTFWSFIRKGGERGPRDNFPVLVRSRTAAAIPLARSGFRVLIDFSIPPAFIDTARKILKEVPFDFVLLRPSLQVRVERAASREKGAITENEVLKDFYALLEDEGTEPICEDTAAPASLARRIAGGCIKAGPGWLDRLVGQAEPRRCRTIPLAHNNCIVSLDYICERRYPQR